MTDLRPLAFLENIIAIYKGLDASPSSNLLQPVYSGTANLYTFYLEYLSARSFFLLK